MFKYSVKKDTTSGTDISVLEMANICNFLICLKPQAFL